MPGSPPVTGKGHKADSRSPNGKHISQVVGMRCIRRSLRRHQYRIRSISLQSELSGCPTDIRLYLYLPRTFRPLSPRNLAEVMPR